MSPTCSTACAPSSISGKSSSASVPHHHPAGWARRSISTRCVPAAVPPEQLPGVVLANELYLEGGVRGVEIGSAMFGKHDPKTGTPVGPRWNWCAWPSRAGSTRRAMSTMSPKW